MKKGYQKSIAVLLIILMITMLGACGSTPGSSSKPSPESAAPSSTNSAAPSSDTAPDITPVTVTVACAPGVMADWNNYQNSGVQEEMKRLTGITFEYVDMDPAKFKVLMASGDLPDIVDLNAGQGYSKDDLIKSGNLIQLDDLMPEYAKNIMSIMPTSIEFSKKFWSTGDGHLYFIPRQVGVDGAPQEISIGAYIRWDYYKELGYPAVNSVDDLLNVLVQMTKAHPTADNGKKTYGVSGFTDWGMSYEFSYLIEALYGYFLVNNTISVENSTNTAMNNYLDTNSPYWRTVDFFYKANKLGIFDKDALTQKNDDYIAKIEAGQTLMSEANWNIGNFNTDNAKDGVGFMNLPIPGMNCWNGMSPSAGWTLASCAITKNCKHPERALQLLDFTASYDGARLLYSGVKGKEWDVVNGTPTLTDSTLKAKQVSGEEWKSLCLSVPLNFMGISPFTINPQDNTVVNLFNSPEVFRSSLTALQQDYCDHYGATYPTEVFTKLMAEGKMKDQSNFDRDIQNAMKGLSDDLKLTDANLVEIATGDFAKCVLSKDDAEYANNQANAINDLKSAGADKIGEYCINAWNEAKAEIESIKK